MRDLYYLIEGAKMVRFGHDDSQKGVFKSKLSLPICFGLSAECGYSKTLFLLVMAKIGSFGSR